METIRKFCDSFFSYSTPKIVKIKNKKIGILYRLIQTCILLYVFVYSIFLNNGYQVYSGVESAVATKVKGVADTLDIPSGAFRLPASAQQLYRRIWDTPDYQVPPSETNAFFLMTNVAITPNQKLDKCPESADEVKASICTKDGDCEAGRRRRGGNGPETGKCVGFSGVRTCEVRTWCPVENDTLPLADDFALLQDVQNFTVLIKNTVRFTRFDITRRNIFEAMDGDFLRQCYYGPEITEDDHPLCPKFRIGDIIKQTGYEFNEVASKGAIIGIFITWNCDLDEDIERCKPVYSFARMDADAITAPGWNFRYAHYHELDRRTLYKAYGIRFMVIVDGRGGQFSMIPLLLNIGSGLGLMAITKIITDFVVFQLHDNSELYKHETYVVISDKDEESGLSKEIELKTQNADAAYA
ncbi:P2X purinoceptor 4 [Halotydeus destructor]|nr:P2X purinoceptor 4 [Halotydeus destructor]